LTDGSYNGIMSIVGRLSEGKLPRRLYFGPDIPRSVIRRCARKVAERFQPDKIILFGSYAYGQPHADSDVDLLVIVPARNQIDQAVKIRWAFPAPFAMDLLVRTPKNMQWRLAEGDSFLTEIVTNGKVLYEKAHKRVGAKGRGRSRNGKRSQPTRSSRA
jgi:predicted nucleotidyltransferase